MIDMRVRITRSKRRKKTASARLEDGVLSIRVPAALSEEKIKSLVGKFNKSVRKKRKVENIERENWLVGRVERLNKKYFGGKIIYKTVKWSRNQKKIYGSCTFKRKVIRISSRLAKRPKWVLDYILIHEMAHLVEPNHSKNFWRLVNQYKRAERARGYLMGLGYKEEE